MQLPEIFFSKGYRQRSVNRQFANTFKYRIEIILIIALLVIMHTGLGQTRASRITQRRCDSTDQLR